MASGCTPELKCGSEKPGVVVAMRNETTEGAQEHLPGEPLHRPADVPGVWGAAEVSLWQAQLAVARLGVQLCLSGLLGSQGWFGPMDVWPYTNSLSYRAEFTICFCLRRCIMLKIDRNLWTWGGLFAQNIQNATKPVSFWPRSVLQGKSYELESGVRRKYQVVNHCVNSAFKSLWSTLMTN